VNRHRDHSAYEDDLAAYLLDALTEAERRDIERHIEGCPRCQERARWLQASVEVLPTAVEQLEPPPELRERLMQTVRAEAGAPPARETAPAHRDRRAARGRGWTGRLLALPRPAIALGAMLLVVGAGAVGYGLGTGDDASRVTTVEAEVAPPGARATLEHGGDSGILRVSGLPQRRDRIYEVWIQRGERVRPAGLFQVDPRGRGAAAIPAGLDDADRVMVSLEPPGGSAQPTTEPLIVTDV
jgi:anti-sigma-K factor RskA